MWLPSSASTTTRLASGLVAFCGIVALLCLTRLAQADPELSTTIRLLERTLRTTPVDSTHWSIRSMAAETGFSHTTIHRMWGAFGLQPHRSQTFKLSNDPLFVDKVRDIV